MKIIRMVRTEMEAPGNIDFVRWGDIYPMPGTPVPFDANVARSPETHQQRQWKIHKIQRCRKLGDVPETLHYTIEDDLLQEVVLADQRMRDRYHRENTGLTMQVHSLEGQIERASTWRRLKYLFTRRLNDQDTEMVR